MITQVRNRDGHYCVGAHGSWADRLETYLPEQCYGPLNGHEVITRADGGSITDPDNIVLLCDFHNGWCDLNHDEADLPRVPGPTPLETLLHLSEDHVAARLPHLGL